MKICDLVQFLKQAGIWRAKIVESSSLDDIGVIEIHVPKTSLHKVDTLIKTYLPAALCCKVYVLDKPLQYKKYSYHFDIAVSFGNKYDRS